MTKAFAPKDYISAMQQWMAKSGASDHYIGLVEITRDPLARKHAITERITKNGAVHTEALLPRV